MREDYKPGDLSVRLGFARVYGGGPDQGQIRPHLEITDQCSGKTITVNLSAESLTEMLSGSAAEVRADQVMGFRGLRDWGKRQEIKTLTVDAQPGDWKVKRDGEAAELPHVAALIAKLEADGYRVDAPRRNNAGKWVVTGRRYVEQEQ